MHLFLPNPKNKNRALKIDLKTTITSYYIKVTSVGLVIAIIAFFWYIKVTTPNQSGSHTIPSTKIETHDEWFQAKEKQRESENYYDSYRIDYSEEAKEKLKNIKANELELTVNGVKIEGTPMIKRTYTFYGLTGLRRGHHPEHEPTDLAPFVKNPFNKWHDPNHVLSEPDEYFDYFHTKNKDKDSQFNNHMQVSTVNHNIYINYEGPKWLLEEDKDFFMDEVECRISKDRIEDGRFAYKNYYLHFNPKQGYITLYTQKFNTKENK
ncbi:hypothetical protein [Candidatus Phytoplasma solani]|uniref:hypothetical protein n=1 Tax=Candidatus Phytoplasma solani TaxID=69896 RepID=UPI0035902989